MGVKLGLSHYKRTRAGGGLKKKVAEKALWVEQRDEQDASENCIMSRFIIRFGNR
jgi:hypothetical protein